IDNYFPKLLDVAEGVAFLHSLHTTHGDIKGDNFFIDHSGHACLANLGFTSVVHRASSVLVTVVQGYSPRWAAPEVLLNDDARYTREADMFSFGMTVIEVFTRRPPFDKFTNYVAQSKIIEGERPDHPQEPGLSDSVWQMTVDCWAQEPAQRPT
ncbi:kinase-like domain-containing protein, partial [Thelephora terrestris]